MGAYLDCNLVLHKLQDDGICGGPRDPRDQARPVQICPRFHHLHGNRCAAAQSPSQFHQHFHPDKVRFFISH